MKLDNRTLQKIAEAISRTRPEEIDCGECFAQMDRLAEMVFAGSSAEAALPQIADHLARCPDCTEEFEALLKALRQSA